MKQNDIVFDERSYRRLHFCPKITLLSNKVIKIHPTPAMNADVSLDKFNDIMSHIFLCVTDNYVIALIHI